MILKKITLENIRSFTTESITFPTGTMLLSGGIGAGKTTILLAIEYALFGLQPGQRGAALLAHTSDEGKVTLELEIGDNYITIERQLKRKAKTVAQESAAITVNGERIESSITEIKSKILELLNYPYEFIKKTNTLYRFTVYTPQEEMKQIILEQPESRLNILRHIFGIDKYKKIRENLTVVTANMREEARMRTVEVRDLDIYKNEYEATKSLIKHRLIQMSEKRSLLEQKVRERLKKEEERADIKGRIKEKERFEKEVEKTTIMLTTKRAQYARDEEYIRELQSLLDSKKERFTQEELDRVIAHIGQKKNEYDKLLALLIDHRSKQQSLDLKKQEEGAKKNRVFKIDICPTCLQDVPEVHKHNILSEVETSLTRAIAESKKIEEETKHITREMQTVRAEVEHLEERKSALELLRHTMDEIAQAKEKLSELRHAQEQIMKDVSFLDSHMNFLKESVLEFSKFTRIHDEKEREVREAQQSEKEVEIEIAQLTTEVEMLHQKKDSLQERIEKTQKTRDRLHHILELEKWLANDYAALVSYTERTIMVSVRQEFSRLFNKWFSMLTTDAFLVHLDENFTPVITQGDIEVEYAYLSGGERTAVALAYRLALNQILDSMFSDIKTKGLIILDEPTDGFSEAQLDKVRDIIQELKAHQVIIVSHEQKIESFVDNIIRVSKTNGVSQHLGELEASTKTI